MRKMMKGLGNFKNSFKKGKKGKMPFGGGFPF